MKKVSEETRKLNEVVIWTPSTWDAEGDRKISNFKLAGLQSKSLSQRRNI